MIIYLGVQAELQESILLSSLLLVSFQIFFFRPEEGCA